MLTAASPTVEYYVQATNGRTFIWSATDLEDLIRQLVERGVYASRILPYGEYEAEQEIQHEQERLQREHIEEIEKGEEAA
ncbi:hypothetical protein [Paenibacillus spongiae]|uniref:Uncharacterized protein n=1 Tax=Paenibacillus spongiae TaxID=2909671 RepID=A0ABY5SEI9_9BACL|nr:hypothetical protein [Paenibacillus spongiae]UVI31182.1 hypothetical protein L1F29_04890 [Paenibacillus spongiae]